MLRKSGNCKFRHVESIGLAREKKVNVREVPTRHAIKESVDVARKVFNCPLITSHRLFLRTKGHIVRLAISMKARTRADPARR
jgi:hypothetical protein